jgi:hypothetical protein
METKNHHKDDSPLAILKELAVEGTSSMVEAQRTLLKLAQQENNIVLGGVKERLGGFAPAVSMTDLVRRGLDTLIEMQQELLTNTSKQTLHWLELEKSQKGERASQLVEFAREGVETFTRAQKKLLEAVTQETEKATQGKREHAAAGAKKTELSQLAREAADAFVEAQKRLLDVMGQQMNVNLDATARAVEMLSPSRLAPMASATGERVRDFVDAETSLIGKLILPRKKAKETAKRRARRQTARRPKAVPV